MRPNRLLPHDLLLLMKPSMPTSGSMATGNASRLISASGMQYLDGIVTPTRTGMCIRHQGRHASNHGSRDDLLCVLMMCASRIEKTQSPRRNSRRCRVRAETIHLPVRSASPSDLSIDRCCPVSGSVVMAKMKCWTVIWDVERRSLDRWRKVRL